jgi:hypothetical protein
MVRRRLFGAVSNHEMRSSVAILRDAAARLLRMRAGV